MASALHIRAAHTGAAGVARPLVATARYFPGKSQSAPMSGRNSEFMQCSVLFVRMLHLLEDVSFDGQKILVVPPWWRTQQTVPSVKIFWPLFAALVRITGFGLYVLDLAEGCSTKRRAGVVPSWRQVDRVGVGSSVSAWQPRSVG